MRSVIVKRSLILGAVVMAFLGVFEANHPIVRLNKKNVPLFGDYKRGFLGKSSAPFSLTKEFSWVDQSIGTGVVTVNLKGESFTHSQWHYRWRLPEGVSTTQTQEQDLPTPAMGVFEPLSLEVRGLNSNSNQNVILELSPVNGNDQNVVIIIPSHYDQTKEAEASAPLKSQSKLSMQKTVSGLKRGLPEGIQF